jgi:hypothetical protein
MITPLIIDFALKLLYPEKGTRRKEKEKMIE